MSNNALKKTIVFSSIKGKKLIDAIIDDTAEATGMTVSAALEYELLYNALLPKNRYAMLWAEDMYSGRSTVGDCISVLSMHLAAGINGRPRTDALFERIIWFCRRYGADSNAAFADIDEVNYLREQVECVADVMRRYGDADCENFDYIDIGREAAALEVKTADAERTLHIDAWFIWEVLSAYPDAVKQYGRTYRMIGWLAKHCAWDNSAKARYNLLQLLRAVSLDEDSHNIK